MEIKIIKNDTNYIASVMTRTTNITVHFECNIINNKLYVKILNDVNTRIISSLIEPINKLFNNKHKLLLKNISYNTPLDIDQIFSKSSKTDERCSFVPTSTKVKRKLDQDDDEKDTNIKIKRVKMNTSEDRYLGASNTKYFQNDDILGYNLKLLKINNIDRMIDFAKSQSIQLPLHTEQNTSNFKGNEIMNYIFDRGIEFEKYICNKLKVLCSKLHLSYIEIVDGKPLYDQYDNYLQLTKNAINNKIDIIYQGMIQTPDKHKYKFRGFPDLLVSLKAFKLLFYNYIDKTNCFNISLDLDDNINNYIVIDIKSSTILLNADGKTARNTGLLKYYKTQLATYGYIMNTLYTKKKTLTYILPYNLKMEYYNDKHRHEHIIVNPLNSNKFCLVKIDLLNKDNEYFLNLNNIYNAYLDCLIKYDSFTLNKSEYKFLYENQIQELNEMFDSNDYDTIEKIKKCNRLLDIDSDSLKNHDFSEHDIPFVRNNFGNNENSSIKMWIAKQVRSLSLLRGFNHKELLLMKEQGIYSYLQTNEIINYLDSRENRNDTDMIKSIVQANSDKYNKPFYCNSVKDKLKELNTKFMNKKIICCLDFETIPLKLINNRSFLDDEDVEITLINDINSSNDLGQKIFMIGCTFYENKNNKFVNIKNCQFYLDNILDIDNDIYKMFLNLEKEVNEIKNNKKLIDSNMAFVIWSPYEISIMKQISRLNSFKPKFKYVDNKSFLFNIEIIDLMKVFADNNNPIGVKYAFDYSIKSIANGLYNSDLLDEKQIWNSSNIVNGYDAMYYALWYYRRSNSYDQKYLKIFEKIKDYNITDCSIMADIINVLYVNILN
jgi:hypothetical protein